MADGTVVRPATPDDAATVAGLLDAFNREFGDDTPGPEVLTRRLTRLLAGDQTTMAFLAGEGAGGAEGVAVLTLRPNVWFDGPVGLLDELYVVPDRRNHGLGSALLAAVEGAVRSHGGELLEIQVDGEDTDARRFYERHGYRCVEPGRPEAAVYYSRYLVT